MEKRTVYVINYEHIDHWFGISEPKHIAEMVREETLPCSMKSAAFAFKMAGWEGKGSITAFWIPPFMFRYPDTYGVHIWHVKQSTNGTSWLCADEPYEFPALADLASVWKPIEVDEPPRNPEYIPFTGQSIQFRSRPLE